MSRARTVELAHQFMRKTPLCDFVQKNTQEEFAKHYSHLRFTQSATQRLYLFIYLFIYLLVISTLGIMQIRPFITHPLIFE